MIFAKDKVRKARRVFLFLAVGLFLDLGITMVMWTWGAMVTGNQALILTINVPALVTAGIAFIAGATIRGQEIHTAGMDIERMDEYETVQTIAFLEKKRREMATANPDADQDPAGDNNTVDFDAREKGKVK